MLHLNSFYLNYPKLAVLTINGGSFVVGLILCRVMYGNVEWFKHYIDWSYRFLFGM